MLLLLRTVLEDRFAAKAGCHNIQADAHINLGKLFRNDGIAKNSDPGSTILLGNPRAYKAVFRRLLADLRCILFMLRRILLK